MDGPPLLAAFESNEGLLSGEDSHFRTLAKALKVSTEAGEAQSKAFSAVSEGFVSVGRFECEHGDDPQGILGKTKPPFLKTGKTSQSIFSSIRRKIKGN